VGFFALVHTFQEFVVFLLISDRLCWYRNFGTQFANKLVSLISSAFIYVVALIFQNIHKLINRLGRKPLHVVLSCHRYKSSWKVSDYVLELPFPTFESGVGKPVSLATG